MSYLVECILRSVFTIVVVFVFAFLLSFVVDVPWLFDPRFYAGFFAGTLAYHLFLRPFIFGEKPW